MTPLLAKQKCYQYEKTVSEQKVKDQGVVYTPIDIVSYINESLLSEWIKDNKNPPNVCDFSCGSGIFLVDAAEKIASLWNVSFDEAQKYIYGSDIDQEAIKVAQQVLPKANIHVQDGFTVSLENIDIIVGNPPYVRIQNLDESTRNVVKNFYWCEGDFDIYVSFLEKAFKSVDYFGFICPNGWLKNKSNKLMRDDIIKSQRLYELIDFQDVKVFPGFGTYTSIILINNKQNQQLTIKHRNINNLATHKNYENVTIDNFYTQESDNLFLEKIYKRKNFLYDLCDIKVGIATLYDKAYYLEDCKIIGNLVTLKDGTQIEKEITRPCKKAGSIKKLKQNKLKERLVNF